jgi:hypothetical protein
MHFSRPCQEDVKIATSPCLPSKAEPRAFTKPVDAHSALSAPPLAAESECMFMVRSRASQGPSGAGGCPPNPLPNRPVRKGLGAERQIDPASTM